MYSLVPVSYMFMFLYVIFNGSPLPCLLINSIEPPCLPNSREPTSSVRGFQLRLTHSMPVLALVLNSFLGLFLPQLPCSAICSCSLLHYFHTCLVFVLDIFWLLSSTLTIIFLPRMVFTYLLGKTLAP